MSTINMRFGRELMDSEWHNFLLSKALRQTLTGLSSPWAIWEHPDAPEANSLINLWIKNKVERDVFVKNRCPYNGHFFLKMWPWYMTLTGDLNLHSNGKVLSQGKHMWDTKALWSYLKEYICIVWKLYQWPLKSYCKCSKFLWKRWPWYLTLTDGLHIKFYHFPFKSYGQYWSFLWKMWPWYLTLTLTDDLDLGTTERSYHKEYTCEVWKFTYRSIDAGRGEGGHKIYVQDLQWLIFCHQHCLWSVHTVAFTKINQVCYPQYKECFFFLGGWWVGVEIYSHLISIHKTILYYLLLKETCDRVSL